MSTLDFDPDSPGGFRGRPSFRDHGKARRIRVFDRGIVSEANLAAIRRREGQYLGGHAAQPDEAVRGGTAQQRKLDAGAARSGSEEVAIPPGEETCVLCRTAARKEKEKAIRSRFSSSMERALKSLQKTIATGRLKDRHKMERRLGRIQARHPQVNDLYDVDLRESADGVRLFWHIKEDRKHWREAREGAYLLRIFIRLQQHISGRFFVGLKAGRRRRLRVSCQLFPPERLRRGRT